ncbi:glycosyltransferase family 4 protein [Actinokineospora sp. HUAS TT18]|uniref:glycosyltransferase family 4 protein n=1 Tax=Actinokineospora sp. HUAS TT18 TaxID=3447451 RepID=UPI003F520A0F
MKVGLLAPPWLPVPPPGYGGTESFIDRLARGLDKQGHDVVLFTTGDSETTVPIRYALELSAMDRIQDVTVELHHVCQAYAAMADRDLVHDHTLAGPVWGLAFGRQPVVTTCHGPLVAQRDIFRHYGLRLPVIAISHDQAARAPDVPVARVIHHGVDAERFPSGTGSGGYLLFLGRMIPEKGVHEAITVAREAGMPLKIAAKMREPAEHAYFAEHVEPHLGGTVEYLGEATANEAMTLLAGAVALLNPIQWPEPFGLVMIEALACGTPVVTLRAGAAPEIVDDGVTGFVCDGHDELVAAVGRVGELDRRACRAVVADYFCTGRVVADHLRLYEEMIG